MIELDTGNLHAGREGGIGLHRLQVGRGDHRSPSLSEGLENGDAESGPLRGIGPGPDLIEEDGKYFLTETQKDVARVPMVVGSIAPPLFAMWLSELPKKSV